MGEATQRFAIGGTTILSSRTGGQCGEEGENEGEESNCVAVSQKKEALFKHSMNIA
jgi:hypothetical protein